MKTQHTPGPWKAVELDEHTVAIKLDRNYVHECIHIADVHVMSGNLGETVPEAISNAKLIASAPDLLKWKEESMKAWGPVLDFMHANGEKLGMRLGESISEFIVRHFQTVADLNDALTKSRS